MKKLDYTNMTFKEVVDSVRRVLVKYMGKEKIGRTYSNKIEAGDYRINAHYGKMYDVDINIGEDKNKKVLIDVYITVVNDPDEKYLRKMSDDVFSALGIEHNSLGQDKNFLYYSADGRFSYIDIEEEKHRKVGKFRDFLDI